MTNMMIVSEITSQQELIEMKSIMEIFVVNNRIKELVRLIS